jgi:hypothetical protein
LLIFIHNISKTSLPLKFQQSFRSKTDFLKTFDDDDDDEVLENKKNNE